MLRYNLVMDKLSLNTCLIQFQLFRYCLDFSTDVSLSMKKGQLLGIKAEAQRKTFVCRIYLHKFLHSKPQYLHSLGKSLSILFFTVFGKKRFWRYIFLTIIWQPHGTPYSPARPATHMQMVNQKHLHSLSHRKGNVTILQIKNMIHKNMGFFYSNTSNKWWS